MSEGTIVIEPGSHDIVVTREFDAPAELVFQAFTDPELIPHWWGPAKYKVTIDKADIRPGGTWRFLTSDGEGDYNFRGVFHDIVPNERIVQTFEFEGMPGHVSLDTSTFEERDGKTYYRGVTIFQSVEDRDGMAASGMEDGMNEGWQRLDALLSKLQDK